MSKRQCQLSDEQLTEKVNLLKADVLKTRGDLWKSMTPINYKEDAFVILAEICLRFQESQSRISDLESILAGNTNYEQQLALESRISQLEQDLAKSQEKCKQYELALCKIQDGKYYATEIAEQALKPKK